MSLSKTRQIITGHRRASSYGSSVIAPGSTQGHTGAMQLMRGHSQSDLYGPQLYNPYFCKQRVLLSLFQCLKEILEFGTTKTILVLKHKKKR